MSKYSIPYYMVRLTQVLTHNLSGDIWKHRMFTKFSLHWLVWIPMLPSIWQLVQFPFSSQSHDRYLPRLGVCETSSLTKGSIALFSDFWGSFTLQFPFLWYPNPQTAAASTSLKPDLCFICLESANVCSLSYVTVWKASPEKKLGWKWNWPHVFSSLN